MRGDRDDKYYLTVDTLESGFNSGVKYAATAMFLVVSAGFFPLIFGFFRVVSLGHAILWVYAIANALSFVAVAWDKAKARNFQWRISEGMLHLFEGLGGFFGSFLAQQLFRHKTRSVSYQVAFLTIVVIHMAFWTWWFMHGVDRMERMFEKLGVDRNPAFVRVPARLGVDDVEREPEESESRFTEGSFQWVQTPWPIWLPWTVLLPVPLVAAAFERIWVRQFREEKRNELAGRPPPSDAEIADWRTMNRWRYFVGVGALLGKPFLFLLMMAMVAGTGILCVRIWNVGEYSTMSLVLGAIVLFVALPVVQLFYHACCEQLEILNLSRLMATGREDISRMIGIEVRMDDATDIAKDYISRAPGDRIYEVVSIVCWPSLAVFSIAALLHFFGVADVAWLLGNWGAPATLVLYGIVSVVSFVKIRRDKQVTLSLGNAANHDADERRKRSLAESELHCLEMLGGFVGSFVAQHLLQHKTNKFAYQYVFWTIVAFHMVTWVVLLAALEPIPMTNS